MIIGAIIGSVVLMIIIVVSVFVIWKRRNPHLLSQDVRFEKNGEGIIVSIKNCNIYERV